MNDVLFEDAIQPPVEISRLINFTVISLSVLCQFPGMYTLLAFSPERVLGGPVHEESGRDFGRLKKIGGAALGSKMKCSKASEASHMFFSSGGMFSFGLATHPPLDVRIKAIEKSWDGKFQESGIRPVAEGRNTNSRSRK